MLQTTLRPAYILSAIIAILMIVASAGGLFIDDLYRDNTWATTGWLGNDLVTLIVAAPLLIAALILSLRGSQRAQLIWMAMLGYTLYNYAFYLFAAAFNRYFLIYVALFTLAIYALIFGLSNVDINGISQRFRARTPVKWISGFMLFFAVLLGGMWIVLSLGFVATGQVPQAVVDSGHPTSVVFAVDLSLLLPAMVLGAVWLWKRQPWGYVLGVILNVKATTYALALIAMTAFAANAGVPGAWDLAPLWAFLGAGNLIASVLLLRNMQSAD
jgi:hypothetical protein